MSGLRKTMDFLASELDALADQYEADTHRADLSEIEKCYRGGKADALLTAVAKIRDAMERS